MMNETTPLRRVSPRQPCAVCGKPDWCGCSPDGCFAVCMRVPEGAVKTTRNGGFLHVLCEDPDWPSRPRVRTLALATRNKPPTDFGPLATGYAASVEMAEVQGFAEQLGVSVGSLVRLAIGWAADHRAWSFPMYDAARCVQGIRLRSLSGRKWSVRGGREGLFLPTGLDFSKLLMICEGPTDTAALLDLGFEAIGRPSCSGGTMLLAEILRRAKPSGAVIVADRDGPGQRGAEGLAMALLPVCRSVRVVCPPEGIKDARAWKQAGATLEDVRMVIDSTPERSLTVTRRAKR